MRGWVEEVGQFISWVEEMNMARDSPAGSKMVSEIHRD